MTDLELDTQGEHVNLENEVGIGNGLGKLLMTDELAGSVRVN